MKTKFLDNKIILFVFVAAICWAGFLLPSFVKAVDSLVVEFQNTPHLFSETNFLPGQSVTRWVKVTNNSGGPQRIIIEAINYPGFPDKNAIPVGDLSRALLITIRENGGSDLCGGLTGEKTLFDFYQKGETYLSDIITGITTEYEFEIAFPGEKEDEWQGATTTFDILVGFQGVEGKVSPGGGGGGGGGLPLGLTINYEKPFYIGTTTAKITWDTSYKSTSQVIYGTVAGVFDLNNLPNYGYAFSTVEKDTPANPNGVTNHEVWLSDLQLGTTYYYRAISHGSLAIGKEYSFTTLSDKSNGQTEQNEVNKVAVQEGVISNGHSGQSVVQGGEENQQNETSTIVEVDNAGTGQDTPMLLADIFSFFNGFKKHWIWWILALCGVILFLIWILKGRKK